ncbi:MAG: Rrf2 family transcriptional regulator [Flavobacteriales bacterium]|jgi:Rrf2 family protein|nr:Rrf2 family transcriptional regulator [Flavobacteriales bacterium]MCW8911843.1 Rrf2 family transcriptional regulator [Flavobacteriales bacterium]MCW8936386.1 Rrf2 family transcriptional regulator [Flavobacteriales bacterium]MCW8939979.1 Rrf2 family transcriptional regulator [Flavobacteriales bacterium]MCW8967748.1 Rrf2 family transcriptional regulator [Flavobacteriales bacterium]
MLSKSCVYALRAIVYVGHNSSENHKIGIKEIGEELDLPVHFLSKILQSLVKHNILQSTKGPHGGFYINEVSGKIKLLRIIEVVDGLSFFHKCGLGMHECSDTHPCPLHDDFIVFREGLYKIFATKTINDLVKKVEDGNAFIQNLNTKN